MRRLPQQDTPCLLITASNDRAGPARVSERTVVGMRSARWLDSPGDGHLVHEEAADHGARLNRDFLATHIMRPVPRIPTARTVFKYY